MSLANMMAQIGPVSFLPPSGTRRGIDPADIAWAREKRAAGWGWQAIAMARRLNQTDLMQACGALEKGALSCRPTLAPRLPGQLASGSELAKALLIFVRDGGRGRDVLIERLKIGQRRADDLVRELRDRGFTNGRSRPSEAGEQEAERLARVLGLADDADA